MFSHAALNASLNGVSAILLAGGYAAIRSGKIAVHQALMISAFAVSSVFLASYLLYHYRVGHVAFQGQGWIRPVYFTLRAVDAAVVVLCERDGRYRVSDAVSDLRGRLSQALAAIGRAEITASVNSVVVAQPPKSRVACLPSR